MQTDLRKYMRNEIGAHFGSEDGRPSDNYCWRRRRTQSIQCGKLVTYSIIDAHMQWTRS